MLTSRPDRLVLVAAAASWAWMAADAVAARRLSCCAPRPSGAADFAGWMGMVGAMMLPTTAAAARDVAFRSYRSRRVRAVVGYAGGYLACWAPAGAVFATLRACPLAHDPRAAAALCVLAGAWALLPARAVWFARCHRQIPLCPAGPRADLDAVRQGIAHGTPCVRMCWPLMFACGVTGHDLVVMAAGAALAAAEKRMFRLDRAPLVAGPVALAAWVLGKSALL